MDGSEIRIELDAVEQVAAATALGALDKAKAEVDRVLGAIVRRHEQDPDGAILKGIENGVMVLSKE